MTENNKFERSFGPVGSLAGIVVFLAGLVLTFFHLTAFILVLIGAFVGFSSTSTLIDYDRKRVRFSNNLFGIIKIGRWLNIEPSMKIGMKESDLTWRAFSQGNRALDIVNKDYKIILFDSANKEIMPVKKARSKDQAKIDLEGMGSRLGVRML